ncbi:MAG: FAD-dependent thymidylate synthase [Candidatus Micrarchaeota archaeon]
MKVALISHTPNPDLICAAAARTTIKREGAEEALRNLDAEGAAKTLRRVMGRGHLSVVEHASFTFAIDGISRACSHQLVRHRHASYTQQSQRYVKIDNEAFPYVTPPSMKGKHREKFEKIIRSLAREYRYFLDEGIPAEDARYILPNATCTNIVVTMNARELLNFFGLRCCMRAQWEIRELANRMLAEVKKVAPVIFENAWARCKELGYCPEGEPDCAYPPKGEATSRSLGPRRKQSSGKEG